MCNHKRLNSIIPNCEKKFILDSMSENNCTHASEAPVLCSPMNVLLRVVFQIELLLCGNV